ncbi:MULTISPECIES: GNAT family N-acetyltransferase [Streptomyces]|uniref:Acetyltransferase n=1 Tax=Streptomyces spororaveus TaxID=284039 RepID=A0ABQ3TNS6_9ACTN|nr:MULTISPECIES: GNAT family N-acetyltransferase [Streptomyces]MCM9077602.1 GNAT family N-acetyltransferase [Streptomyces spororaveus]MCX5307919.1 GNAT family N-acetyltransferase [Streptomyces sp. NBC_00160]GHI82060.1 acetyltransferase [Streptomyces spororaveus]
MITSVTLRAAATATAPALVLRPWCADDVVALVEASPDPGLRSEDDGLRWVRAQERGWAAGVRFGFAVLEPGPGPSSPARLVGNVVLKEVAPGKAAAEVGYWTAAEARGRGVAPRALEALTTWSLDAFRADGLERLELLHQVDNPASCRVAAKCGYAYDRTLACAPPAFPLDGHLHVRRAAS